MRSLTCAFLCVVASLGLSGCGMSGGTKLGKAAVDEFHSRYNLEQFDAIYDASDPDFKGALDRETSRKFFERVRRKLGLCSNSSNTSVFYNVTTGGTFVDLRYSRACASGELEEEFHFKVVGKKALLVHYNAISPLLLTD